MLAKDKVTRKGREKVRRKGREKITRRGREKDYEIRLQGDEGAKDWNDERPDHLMSQ